MKLPKLKIAFARRQKKLQATASAARRAPAADDYYDDEPQTNLSSAFVVVLILHVVAVGGIYAFNSIKAARRGQEIAVTAPAPSSAGAPLATKATAPEADLTEKTSPETAPKTQTVMAPVSRSYIHRVQQGETLSKVAAIHGVTVADLEEANGIKSAAPLRPGQALTIPNVKTTAKTTASEPSRSPVTTVSRPTETPATPVVSAASKSSAKVYVVAKGDTAISIARRFGTTPEELLKLNKIEDPKKLQLGQSLKLPAKKSN